MGGCGAEEEEGRRASHRGLKALHLGSMRPTGSVWLENPAGRDRPRRVAVYSGPGCGQEHWTGSWGLNLIPSAGPSAVFKA